MVHCKQLYVRLNAWVGLFKEFSELFGIDIDMNDIYGKLYNNALTANMTVYFVAFNLSRESLSSTQRGQTYVCQKAGCKGMNLVNFMRTHLYASLATLKSAVIFFKEEK